MRIPHAGFVIKSIFGVALTLAFVLPSQSASDTRRAPRQSEMSAADCTKAGAEPTEVCVRWQTSTDANASAAQCVETRQMCKTQ